MGSYTESIQELLDVFSKYDWAPQAIRLMDARSGIQCRCRLECSQKHLSFTLQFPHYVSIPYEFVGEIFGELDKIKASLLKMETMDKKVTVVRLVVEYLLATPSRGHIIKDAFQSLSSKCGWIINPNESVACFGLVDVVVLCEISEIDVTDIFYKTRKQQIIVWMQSNSTIADLRHEILYSGAFDNNELVVHDLYTDEGGCFDENVLITEIVSTVSLKEDIKCMIAPDDSILM